MTNEGIATIAWIDNTVLSAVKFDFSVNLFKAMDPPVFFLLYKKIYFFNKVSTHLDSGDMPGSTQKSRFLIL